MENKTLLEKIISSDASLTFLMVNICGIMWWSALKGKALPDGMVTMVLGIYGGKTAYSIVKAKSDRLEAPGNNMITMKLGKKP